MRRRNVLQATAALMALQGSRWASLATRAAAATAVGRVRPGMTGWPTEDDWASLNQAVDGRLSPSPCLTSRTRRCTSWSPIRSTCAISQP
jgi:hypothetical protein